MGTLVVGIWVMVVTAVTTNLENKIISKLVDSGDGGDDGDGYFENF
jgi:hypothetical protein